MGRDYYKILGVKRDADTEEIHKAYVKLAKEWHPDLKRNLREKELAKTKFQDIAEAWEVLSHTTRRKVFDRGGEEALSAGGNRTTTSPLHPGLEDALPPNSANRIAGQFFGYGIPGLDPVSGRPLGGNNIHTTSNIPGFGQSGKLNGTSVKNPDGTHSTTYSRINIPPISNPVKPKKEPKRPYMLPCECTLEELFTGCKKVIKWDSYKDGEQRKKEITIDVEPGWFIGQKVDYEDDTDELMIIILETKHPHFERKKENLFYKCELTIEQAMCCGEIIIPTIVKSKNLKLKFNGSINNGFVHEIKGHGMPYVGGKYRGRLIVTFSVKLPKYLTRDQRRRIGEILREGQNDPFPNLITDAATEAAKEVAKNAAEAEDQTAEQGKTLKSPPDDKVETSE